MPTVTLSNHKTYEAPADVSMLDAARQARVMLAHSCRTGRCGTCKAQVVSGRTVRLHADTSLSAAERAAGWVLTCTDAAADDVVLDLEDLGALADVPVLTLPCRIDTLERVAPDVLRVVLRLPPTSRFRWLAGQYIDLRAPDGATRSYSIANAPGVEGAPVRIELHVRQVDGGHLSRYWFERAAPGDLLRFEGPRGSFFLRDVAARDVVLLATGTGIAPVKALLEALCGLAAVQRPRSLRLFWGNRDEVDLYWQPAPELVEALALQYVPVLSRAGSAWPGTRGHVQDAALASGVDWTSAAVYACGSPAMIDAARARLVAHGLDAKRFLSDAFVSSAPLAESSLDTPLESR